MKKNGGMFIKNKSGQVTIFIILALLIVILGVLIYLFFPKIKTTIGLEAKSPPAFIQACIEEEIENNVNLLSLRGGSVNPGHYFLYDNEKIEYLCYTNEYYIPCVMQQPMLKQHIEKEIVKEIESEAKECFKILKENYENDGYEVNLRVGEINAELLPKRIVLTFENSLTLEKDTTERYDTFRVVVNNNIYELVSIANSILNWEARFGDAETTLYMNYYHDLKVEKLKQTDGTTIYILTDRNNENKFQFASRSVAWPPGYAIEIKTGQ